VEQTPFPTSKPPAPGHLPSELEPGWGCSAPWPATPAPGGTAGLCGVPCPCPCPSCQPRPVLGNRSCRRWEATSPPWNRRRSGAGRAGGSQGWAGHGAARKPMP